MRKTQVSRHRHISVATIISLALLLSACINPFQTAYEESSGGDGNSSPYATLRVSSGGISAATVAPDLADLKAQISSYTLTLTNVTPGTHDPIVIIDYVEGTPVTGIPVPSDWTLTLQGFNASAELIAEGAPVGGNPVVFPDANPVNVSVALQPLTAGTGELDFTLDWSAAATPGIQVDAVEVTLYSFANAEGESLILSVGNESLTFTNINVSTTATATVNFATETITVTDTTLNSGSYRLNVTLLKDDGGFIPYAPVIEAVQIYDNLLSSGTASLVAGDLTTPPAAPTDIVVEINAENTFNVYWTDNSNTEEGYRIYEDDGVTRQQLGADHAAGTTSVTNQSSTFALPVDDFTLEVVAFNQFGESAPLSFTFRLLPAAQFPNFQNSINTNSPLWAAAANPGSVNWDTMIVGGGSAVNLYLDTADISDPSSLPAPTLLGAPPYDLTESGPFTPGSTYSWRVENVGDVGNEGRVIYPVETLTIRDGNLYVATTGNAGAAGSATDPVDTITAAVGLAEVGETLRITQGTYDDGPVTITQDVTLEGSYETTAYTTRTVNATTIVTAIGQHTYAMATDGLVLLDRIEVRAPDSTGGPIALRFDGGDLSLAESRVVIPNGVGAGVGIPMGIRISGATGSVTVNDSVFSLGGVLSGEARGIWLTNGNVSLTVSNTNFVTDGLQADNLIWIPITPSTGTRVVNITGSTFGGDISVSANPSAVLEVGGDAPNTSITFAENTINPINNDNWPLHGVSLQGAVGPTSIRLNSFDMMKTGQGNVRALATAGVGGQTPLFEANRIRVPARTTSGTSFGVEVTGDSGADIANNVIELSGIGAALASYGIFTTSPDTRVVNNTIVVGQDYGAGAATHLVWFQTGSTGIVHNNILWSRPPALHTGIQNAVGNSMTAVANVFSGTSDDVITLNSQGTLDAGNMGIDPGLDTVEVFPNPNWYRPIAPTATGTPLAVRSLVLAGGIDDHRGVGGLAPVDIDGNPRVAGEVSIGAYQVAGTTTLGALGPAGGLVFYENPNYRDAVEEWRFLEAAAVDYDDPNGPTYLWADPVIDVPLGTGEAIGTGRQNTTDIITSLGVQSGRAAHVATLYNGGGLTDWFLPSRFELQEMQSVLQDNLALGAFTAGESYWSSTQSDVVGQEDRSIAIGFIVPGGSVVTALQTVGYLVRPVRQF